jgi:probable F420-dependent oxidoreductase
VRFGLYGLHRGSNVEPSTLAARAARAEEAGFESLWVGDHIALPPDAPDPAGEPRLEAIAALTFLAAVTSSVRLGVGVLVLPQRQPVLLAKQLTSLDVLSGGRLIVGIAAGYVEEELRALGVSPRDRGAMTDEHVAVLRTLWAGRPVSFDGTWVSFSEVQQSPPPSQRPGPGPPIVVGGHAPAALRRAGRLGDGWFGWELDPAQVEAALAVVAEAASEAGRGGHEFEVTIAAKPPFTREAVERLAEAGVDRVVLQPDGFADAEIDRLIDLAGDQLIP